jgi:hypothetical protein
MMTDTLHPLAADYLDRLRRAGRVLPAERLRELLVEIEGHLSEAIDPSASDAQALNALDKLGEPEAIIAAELPDLDEVPVDRGAAEWGAILLLLLGGFIFAIGWLVGLVLLWNSRAWTTRDKLVGTLIVPGGLAISLPIGLVLLGHPVKTLCRGIVGGAQHCTTTPGQSIVAPVLGIAVLTILVLTPIATSMYLARSARAA